MIKIIVSLVIVCLLTIISYLSGMVYGLQDRLNDYSNMAMNVAILENIMPEITTRQITPKEAREVASQAAIIEMILQSEGIYSRTADDRGGETLYGLTRKFFPKNAAWGLVDQMKRKHKTPQSLKKAIVANTKIRNYAAQEYASLFRKFGLNNLTPEMGYAVFDTMVNQGFTNGVELVQKTINAINLGHQFGPDMVLDGVYGTNTKNRLVQIDNSKSKELFIEVLYGLRHAGYTNLAAGNPSQRQFLKGWINRINK